MEKERHRERDKEEKRENMSLIFCQKSPYQRELKSIHLQTKEDEREFKIGGQGRGLYEGCVNPGEPIGNFAFGNNLIHSVFDVCLQFHAADAFKKMSLFIYLFLGAVSKRGYGYWKIAVLMLLLLL